VEIGGWKSEVGVEHAVRAAIVNAESRYLIGIVNAGLCLTCIVQVSRFAGRSNDILYAHVSEGE
jgi:hypothetical protein